MLLIVGFLPPIHSVSCHVHCILVFDINVINLEWIETIYLCTMVAFFISLVGNLFEAHSSRFFNVSKDIYLYLIINRYFFNALPSVHHHFDFGLWKWKYKMVGSFSFLCL